MRGGEGQGREGAHQGAQRQPGLLTLYGLASLASWGPHGVPLVNRSPWGGRGGGKVPPSPTSQFEKLREWVCLC